MRPGRGGRRLRSLFSFLYRLDDFPEFDSDLRQFGSLVIRVFSEAIRADIREDFSVVLINGLHAR